MWKQDEGSSLGLIFPAGKKVLAQEVFLLQSLCLSHYTFLLLALCPARIPFARVAAPCSPSSPLTALGGFVY